MAKQNLAKVVPGVHVDESDLRDPTDNGRGVLRIVRGTYDVSGGDSGAIGAHDLVDEDGNTVTIPANSIIIGGAVDVQTTFTDGGDDDVTIQVEADDGTNDDDIVAAVAVADVGNPWDQGLHGVIQDPTDPATWTKVATERNLRVTTALDTLTAGKMTVFVFYLASE